MKASRIVDILSKPQWKQRIVYIKVHGIVYRIKDITRHVQGITGLDAVTIDAGMIDDNISELLKDRSEKP